MAGKVGIEIIAAQAVGGKRMWSLLKQIGWKNKGSSAGLSIKTKDNTLARSPEERLEAWTYYFEELGKGVQGEEFDEEHHNRVIREMSEWQRAQKRGERGERITSEEVER